MIGPIDMYISALHDVHVSEGKKLRWTIASARQNLPTVVGLAAREPQDIYRRDKLVARVVSADTDAAPPRPSLAAKLAELQQICAEENYTLATPERAERRNPFAQPARPRRKPRR